MAELTESGIEPHHVEIFVLQERMGEFERRIQRLQAMARKLDLPPWEVTHGPASWRAFASGRPEQMEGRSVHIKGVAPVLNGWRFLAKIEHDTAGNLVKSIAGNAEAPLAWGTCAPDCDHCKVTRARATTFMVRNHESAELRQVGSTCVADFLGRTQREPEQLIGMFDYLSDVATEFEYDPDADLSEGMVSAAYGVAPAVLMGVVLKLVQEDAGYVSAQKAEGLRCLSTGERLRGACWGAKPQHVTPDAGHLELAPQVVDWLKGQREGETVWLRNIAVLAGRECITVKDAGLFASGYVAWNRSLQAQLRQGQGACEWIGAPGEKLTVGATLERHAAFETAFGLKTVLTFRDEEGNALVWKTQAPAKGLIVGSHYHLCGTVKGHGEFRDEKQTEVIRVKVAELELFELGSMPSFKKFAAIATPDVLDDRGHTPLLKAVWADQLEHARTLLDAGADPNFRNQGDIPVLADAKSVAMAELLLSEGASCIALDEECRLALPEEIRSLFTHVKVEVNGAVDGDTRVENSADKPVVVSQGIYSGSILQEIDGVVAQKTNRTGDTVHHAVQTLSRLPEVGETVDIRYRAGKGEVSAPAHAVQQTR